MGKLITIVHWSVAKLCILMAALVVLLPISPINHPYAFKDSGVFLYSGWRILSGEIPYIGIWDHKPPLIFFINALGLGLTNGTSWGVWIIELVSLFFAAYVGYQLLKKLFGNFAAIMGTFFWMYSLIFIIQGGNLTTEYTLPLQFSALYLFLNKKPIKKDFIRFLLVGLLGGLAFFLKQTAIGIWIAIVLYLAIEGLYWNRFKENIKHIAYIILGLVIVASIVCGYLFFNNALTEFWDSSFIYNFFLVGGRIPLGQRIENFGFFSNISKASAAELTILGIISLIFLLIKRELNSKPRDVALLIVALIDFPIELILINIRGNTHPHYYMVILPLIALFTGVLFYIVESRIIQHGQSISVKRMLIFITLGSFIVNGSRQYLDYITSMLYLDNEKTIQYVLANTNKDDSVLIWGAESMINFYSQRVSPTRYVYQYPLLASEYTTEAKILEFLEDIQRNKPQYMIDTNDVNFSILTFPLQSEEIDSKLINIWSMYSEVDQVRSMVIYRLKENN